MFGGAGISSAIDRTERGASAQGLGFRVKVVKVTVVLLWLYTPVPVRVLPPELSTAVEAGKWGHHCPWPRIMRKRSPDIS